MDAIFTEKDIRILASLKKRERIVNVVFLIVLPLSNILSILKLVKIVRIFNVPFKEIYGLTFNPIFSDKMYHGYEVIVASSTWLVMTSLALTIISFIWLWGYNKITNISIKLWDKLPDKEKILS